MHRNRGSLRQGASSVEILKQLLLDPIRSVLQYEIRCVYIIYAQSSIRFQEERQYVNEG